jgi:hypothetical protein
VKSPPTTIASTLWQLNLSGKNFTGDIPMAIENEDFDLLSRIEFVLQSGEEQGESLWLRRIKKSLPYLQGCVVVDEISMKRLYREEGGEGNRFSVEGILLQLVEL